MPKAFHNYDDVHHAIQHFFSFFEVTEANDRLYQLQRAWLVSGKAATLSSDEIDRMLFFYEQVKIVLEASFLLQQERIKKGAKLHCLISKLQSP